MNLKNLLFSKIETITPEEARRMLETERGDEVTLLDVRQPKEYERAHIPKSVLIPLAQLRSRMDEIPRDRPLIVYCASGGRSAAAARMLKGAGFEEVYNLGGGIKAWNGLVASGGPEFGLELFIGTEDFEEVFVAAYSMEHNLGRFYSALAEAVDDPAAVALLKRLAGFEERHKALLLKEWGRGLTSSQVEIIADRIEGALSLDQELQRLLHQGPALSRIIGTAMSIEAQALDLYWRLSQHADSHREFFAFMTEEEAGHLRVLEQELERILEEG